ncbi:MAG: rRNA adenine N-6-methyltransferase family protein [Verrucomicrobiota bacterium]
MGNRSVKAPFGRFASDGGSKGNGRIEYDESSKLNSMRVFVEEWIKRPMEVAAVAPSSIHLARIMAAEISGSTGPVLEMGPGTGVFTKQLLANGVKPEDLLLVEKNKRFAELLKQRFPGLNVVHGDAARVDPLSLGVGRLFGATVSGMGVLSMQWEAVKGILSNSFSNMEEGSAFFQFTYLWRCPVPKALLDELGLKATRIGHTVRNFPPALVYRITRRP